MKNRSIKIKNRILFFLHNYIFKYFKKPDIHCYRIDSEVDKMRDEVYASMDEIIKQAKKTNKIVIKFARNNHFQIKTIKSK